eukprot:TRINITY_DN40113_c0_g1_i1.p1 TRINITY_DN40113_c0_g1~~TRINITY_DN40113_c0_g1_i1.p1  ORF type:complete len:152 (-),score=41.10 TRINITY_DN40113_c0_g1_i1:66-521(-)
MAGNPGSQQKGRSSWLDNDKDFHYFVGRMVQGAALEDYAEEQLHEAMRSPAGRRRLQVLQKCRGQEGKGLDVTCFCREACFNAYTQLAVCIRSASQAEAQDTNVCRLEAEALTGCVRDEWKQFLLAASPSLQSSALERIEKTISVPNATAR